MAYWQLASVVNCSDTDNTNLKMHFLIFVLYQKFKKYGPWTNSGLWAHSVDPQNNWYYKELFNKINTKGTNSTELPRYLCNKLSTVPTYLFSSSAAIAHHMTIVKQAEKSLSQPRPLALFRWSRKNSVWKPLYSVNKAKAAPLPPYRQQEGAEV